MKNISPLCEDDKQIFEEIVNNKKLTRKTNLLAHKSYIIADYDTYEVNKNNLELMTPDARVSTIKEDLWSCYSNGIKADEIKRVVFNNMPKALQARCPYCMISEPNTYDHYLDKADFPEFSIYSNNLIPCCSKCNTKKRTTWLIGGVRAVFNNYYDNVPSYEYLRIDVEMRGGMPTVVNVTLVFSVVSGVNDIIRNHYTTLELYSRYKKQAQTSLEQLVESCLYPSKPTKAFLLEALSRKIVGNDVEYGVGFWETALYKGVLANNDVMDFLSA